MVRKCAELKTQTKIIYHQQNLPPIIIANLTNKS